MATTESVGPPVDRRSRRVSARSVGASQPCQLAGGVGVRPLTAHDLHHLRRVRRTRVSPPACRDLPEVRGPHDPSPANRKELGVFGPVIVETVDYAARYAEGLTRGRCQAFDPPRSDSSRLRAPIVSSKVSDCAAPTFCCRPEPSIARCRPRLPPVSGVGDRACGTAAFVTAARGQLPQLPLQGAARAPVAGVVVA